MQDTRYKISPACQLDKLLFEELKMDSGQWKVNVSTAWIYLKYIAEGDTTTVNCQLLIFHCAASNYNLPSGFVVGICLEDWFVMVRSGKVHG